MGFGQQGSNGGAQADVSHAGSNASAQFDSREDADPPRGARMRMRTKDVDKHALARIEAVAF